MGVQNVQVLPTNVGVAGFALTWEPFDWGRRRNRVREKSNTLVQARNGAREAESQIGVEVGSKYRKWKEASLLLKATRTGHEAAAEQLKLAVRKPHFSISRRCLLTGVHLQICAARWGRNKREKHNRNFFIDARHGRLCLA